MTVSDPAFDEEFNSILSGTMRLKDEFGELFDDKKEPISNLTTWIFDEDSFQPAAKIAAVMRSCRCVT